MNVSLNLPVPFFSLSPFCFSPAPLPMEHIEKMAAECMQDLNEEDDEGLEEDTELLVYMVLC